MRYNIIWSSAVALSLIITSLSYAQEPVVIEIDLRGGVNETGEGIDNATSEGAIVDEDACLLYTSPSPRDS